MKFKFAVLFACIVILYIGGNKLLLNWAFTKGYLNVASKIIFEFSFLAVVLCIALLFKVNKVIVIAFAVIFAFAFVILAYGEIYPIDTTTEPIDVRTLEKHNNGDNLIVREYQNAKTGRIIHDTVKVHDYFIFRKFIGR